MSSNHTLLTQPFLKTILFWVWGMEHNTWLCWPLMMLTKRKILLLKKKFWILFCQIPLLLKDHKWKKGQCIKCPRMLKKLKKNKRKKICLMRMMVWITMHSPNKWFKIKKSSKLLKMQEFKLKLKKKFKLNKFTKTN